MSMTALSFSCNKCDFTGSSWALWGDLNYKHENKLLGVNRDLGWCDDCAKLCPIEVLIKQDDLDQALIEHEKQLIRYQSAKEPFMQQRSRIAKILRLEPSFPNSILSMKFDIEEASYFINEMREHASFMVNRKSPPRCLSCSSHNIAPLPSFNHPEETDYYEEDKAVYVMDHPKCGGAIKAHQLSIRFSVKRRERFFDIEGIEMKNE